MKIKVKSVNRRQPHNLNEELLCCHDCSAKRVEHPIDVVTFDVQIGDDHYVVEQPSVWPLYYTWQMNLRSEDATTHIKDYDEFSRILEGIEFPDLIAGEHTVRRLKLLVFEAMLWYDKAPTQSKYNDFRLSNLAGLIEWMSR